MNTLVLDYDDLENKYDRNGINFLLYWKAKYPKLKVNMFAIPGRMTADFIKLLDPYRDWIDLCVHGWRHDDNFEVLKWDTNTANIFLKRAEDMGFTKVFKAPGWQITYPQPYNSDPDPTKPVNSDAQLVYRVLMERGYICADQHYNRDRRPSGIRVYCTCNPLMIHGHVEDINVSDPKGRNGMRQMEEEWDPFPWNENTEFRFIKDLSEGELKCVS
jgi:hypothetical protein